MYNLIKMDLYRLIHSVSTYVFMVLAAALAVFSISMTHLDIKAMEKELLYHTTDAGAGPKDPEFVFGVYVSTNPEWINGDIDCAEMVSAQLQSRLLLLLLSVIITQFVIAERKNGFIKNIAGQFPNRSTMVAGKLAATAVLTFVMFAVSVISLLISSFAFWGNRLAFHSVPGLIKILGVQYLLHFSFACLVAFLCFLFDSSVISMAVGIMLSCGLGTIFYGFVDKLFGGAFHIEKYTLETNISSVGAQSTPGNLVWAVTVGICFIFVTTAISMLAVQKRDVR